MSAARSTPPRSPRSARRPAGRHRHRIAVRAGSGIAALIAATTLLLLGAPGNAVSADRSDVAGSGETLAAGGPRSDTVFDVNARPESNLRHVDASIELGLRFVPRVDGVIVGIRVYRPAGATGTQLATLWTGAGTWLTYLYFPPTSGAGWLYADLGNPVQVQRNEEYVVSYHTADGYVADEEYFSSAVTPRGLVHPAMNGDTVDRRNGVFRYSNQNVFPYRTRHSTNYWVDVAFIAGYHPATTTRFTSPTPSCPLSCTPPTPTTTPTGPPTGTITCLVTCPPCPHTCIPPTPTLTPTSQPRTLPPDAVR